MLKILFLSLGITLWIPLSQGKTLRDASELEREALIIKAEEEAIASIQKLLNKKGGSGRSGSEEAELLFRLAEMQLRKAKTTRFFEMQSDEKSAKKAVVWTQKIPSSDLVREAAATLEKITKKHPNFGGLDSVLFFLGFCQNTLGQKNLAERSLEQLLSRFPNSSHRNDALVALGEIEYDSGRFAKALDRFESVAKDLSAAAAPYAKYKAAWSHYNTKDSPLAFATIKKLLTLEFSSEKARAFQTSIRPEVIKDMTLFYSDGFSSEDVISTFKGLVRPEEMVTVVKALSSIYTAHSRHKDTIKLIEASLELMPSPSDRAELQLVLNETFETFRKYSEASLALKNAWIACSEEKHQKVPPECVEKISARNTELVQKHWDRWKAEKKGAETSLKDYFGLMLTYHKTPSAQLAYSDFLFQSRDYESASLAYEEHSLMEGAKTPEESLYAAIEASGKAKNSSSDRQNQLAESFLKRFPKDPRILDVSVLLARIALSAKDLSKAEQHLNRSLSLGSPRNGQRILAEDLYLELLNVKKDYLGISKHAAAFQKNETDPKRHKQLTQILEEADFARIVSDPKLSSEQKQSHYVEYSKKHSGSKLSTDALINAMTLALEGSDPVKSSAYFQKLVQSEVSKDTLAKLARSLALLWIDFSEPREALNLLQTHGVEQDREFVSELTLHFGSEKEFFALAEKLKPESQAQFLHEQFLSEVGRKNWPESTSMKAETRIRALKIEPYLSDITSKELLIELSNASEKALPNLFARALKMVNNKSLLPETRARARRVQAEILERELVSQSTKSSPDRRALVVSIKLEKLAKAGEAWTSVASYDPAPEIQTLVKTKMAYLLTHTRESLLGIEATPELDPKDIIASIDSKLLDLKKSGELQALVTKAPLDPKSSLPPELLIPKMKFSRELNAKYLTSVLEGSGACQKLVNRKACSTHIEKLRNQKEAQIKLALLMTHLELGLGNDRGARWLNQLAKKRWPKDSQFIFQSALLKEGEERHKLFSESFKKGFVTIEGFESLLSDLFPAGQHSEIVKLFDAYPQLAKEIRPEYWLIFAEANAQTGSHQKAYTNLQSVPDLKRGMGNIMMARLAEDFMIDLSKAYSHYKIAFEDKAFLTAHPATSEWLMKKIEYLKSLLPEHKDVALGTRRSHE